MSELKYYRITTRSGNVCNCYFKEDADKVIAHQKYKRCLAMADFCYTNVHCIMGHRLCAFADWKKEWFERWHKRWLELAEKFKEAK